MTGYHSICDTFRPVVAIEYLHHSNFGECDSDIIMATGYGGRNLHMTDKLASVNLPQPKQWQADWVDFHCHSTASDGKLSPEEVVDRAVERGLKVLAITDHDTLAGFRSIRDYAKQRGLLLISGIEFSCIWGGATIHIVGLNMDVDHPALVLAEDSQAKARTSRAELIAQRLGKRLKHDFDFQRLQQIAGSDVISRPDFANYMIEKGLVGSFNSAFKQYLGAGKPGDVKATWPQLAEVTEWIVAAGGTAVMAHAHYYKMTRTKLKACLADFIEAGGTGLEVAYGLMDKQQAQAMTQIAEQMQLDGSRGSDFHGPNQYGLDLGVASSFPEKITPVWHRWSVIN